jgi:peroxiredoxin
VTTDLRVDSQAFAHIVERGALWSRMARAGDRLPIQPLIEVDLGPIHLDRLLHTGPVVLLFVRYASSPACAAALRGYATTLAPALAERDAHLVAVSPQMPDRLRPLKQDFLVASDPRHTLIDALNLGFTSPGADVILGTHRSVLPFAAAVVADRTGRIRLAEVRPDWSDPIPPRQIIEAVPAIVP